MMHKHFFETGSKTGKQGTLQFKPVTSKPKKNPWSDEESDIESDEMETEAAIVPRERVQRKTKGAFNITKD